MLWFVLDNLDFSYHFCLRKLVYYFDLTRKYLRRWLICLDPICWRTIWTNCSMTLVYNVLEFFRLLRSHNYSGILSWVCFSVYIYVMPYQYLFIIFWYHNWILIHSLTAHKFPWSSFGDDDTAFDIYLYGCLCSYWILLNCLE